MSFLFQKDQQTLNPDFYLIPLSIPVLDTPGNVESTMSAVKLPWNIITVTFWKVYLISRLNLTNCSLQLFDSGIPSSFKSQSYQLAPLISQLFTCIKLCTENVLLTHFNGVMWFHPPTFISLALFSKTLTFSFFFFFHYFSTSLTWRSDVVF